MNAVALPCAAQHVGRTKDEIVAVDHRSGEVHDIDTKRGSRNRRRLKRRIVRDATDAIEPHPSLRGRICAHVAGLNGATIGCADAVCNIEVTAGAEICANGVGAIRPSTPIEIVVGVETVVHRIGAGAMQRIARRTGATGIIGNEPERHADAGGIDNTAAASSIRGELMRSAAARIRKQVLYGAQSVSYTHLDVYKRQEQAAVVQRLRTRRDEHLCGSRQIDCRIAIGRTGHCPRQRRAAGRIRARAVLAVAAVLDRIVHDIAVRGAGQRERQITGHRRAKRDGAGARRRRGHAREIVELGHAGSLRRRPAAQRPRDGGDLVVQIIQRCFERAEALRQRVGLGGLGLRLGQDVIALPAQRRGLLSDGVARVASLGEAPAEQILGAWSLDTGHDGPFPLKVMMRRADERARRTQTRCRDRETELLETMTDRSGAPNATRALSARDHDGRQPLNEATECPGCESIRCQQDIPLHTDQPEQAERDRPEPDTGGSQDQSGESEMHNDIAEQAPPFGLGDPDRAQRLPSQNGPRNKNEAQQQKAPVHRGMGDGVRQSRAPSRSSARTARAGRTALR